MNREGSGNFEINKMIFQRRHRTTIVTFQQVYNLHFRRPKGVFWKIWRAKRSYGYEGSEYETFQVSFLQNAPEVATGCRPVTNSPHRWRFSEFGVRVTCQTFRYSTSRANSLIYNLLPIRMFNKDLSLLIKNKGFHN